MGLSPNVLIIEDDDSYCSVLSRYLAKNGVITNKCEEHSLLFVQKESIEITFDIVLLDLFLPDVHGFELLDKLYKTFPQIGIIVITGNNDDVDKVVALELGADDYLVKPFELRYLLARIRSLFRRLSAESDSVNNSPDQNYICIFDGWKFDKRTRFLRAPDGSLFNLTTHETDLLIKFIDSGNALIKRESLVENIFNRQWTPDDRSIDILVSKLRKKLGNKNLIINERARGYRFTPIVEIGE